MSNNQQSSTNSGGIGFTGLLTVAFIVLKLTHVIDWSWWWVLAPLWIGAAVAVVIVTVMLVIVTVMLAIVATKGARR